MLNKLPSYFSKPDILYKSFSSTKPSRLPTTITFQDMTLNDQMVRFQ